MLGWRAWYADGKTYEGVDGEAWKTLPDDGLLTVVVFHASYKARYDGGDWYQWLNDEIHCVRSTSWLGEWEPRPAGCLSCIKRGVAVSDEEFNLVTKAALESSWP